jgi:hypothetical protein
VGSCGADGTWGAVSRPCLFEWIVQVGLCGPLCSMHAVRLLLLQQCTFHMHSATRLARTWLLCHSILACCLSPAALLPTAPQDELTRESYTDATTVLASYGVMLAYIALALGALPPQGRLKQVFVYSRVGLGLGGVAIVAASVAGRHRSLLGPCVRMCCTPAPDVYTALFGSCHAAPLAQAIRSSTTQAVVDQHAIITQPAHAPPAAPPLPAGALGVCSAFGMWSTLIIMEVIPFLVLAVGVDNMFVLAHALQKQHAALPLATRMGLALATVGPSITLAASCEVAAFGLGALTSMPAVRNFSICASVAVLLDFLLQVGGLQQGCWGCWG